MKKQPLAVRETGLSQKDIETLVAVAAIPANTPVNVVEFFRRACGETGLSPFKRQLHLIKRGDKFTIQTAIDGYRTIADRTGKYAGNDDYVFNGGMTEQAMIDAGKQQPETATSTVWKIVGNVRCPFSATVRWKEYFPGDALGFMWKKMPFLMLGKCAEALALRKAFPEETAGIYTEDEITVNGEIEVLRPKIQDVKRWDSTGRELPTDSSGGAESSQTSTHTKKAPAAAPKKFKKPEPKQVLNEHEVLLRLQKLGKTREQFAEAAKLFQVIDTDETWDHITEDKFSTCLDKENWALIEESLLK